MTRCPACSEAVRAARRLRSLLIQRVDAVTRLALATLLEKFIRSEHVAECPNWAEQ